MNLRVGTGSNDGLVVGGNLLSGSVPTTEMMTVAVAAVTMTALAVVVVRLLLTSSTVLERSSIWHNHN